MSYRILFGHLNFRIFPENMMSTEQEEKNLNNNAQNKMQVDRVSSKIRCAIDDTYT